jgi:PIN domain nuclease of toxin-antitoxin system
MWITHPPFLDFTKTAMSTDLNSYFIWFIEGDEQLPEKVRNEIIHIDNDCFLSVASLWEIAIKSSIGKLNLKIPFHKIADYLSGTDIKLLPIEFRHFYQLLNLEFIHRDPFDRIIISQAIVDNFTILTTDKQFKHYPAKCLW